MSDDLNAEIERRRPVALKIAQGFIRRLPRSVLREDVEQAALIGLWDALRHGNYERPGFEWYVRMRIRGSIVDELRAQDWLPRRARSEIGGDIGTGIVHLEDIRSEWHWEERLAELGASAEDVLVVTEQAAEALRAPLQPKDRRTIELVLLRGLRLKDVATEMGCSEPRVSQRFQRGLEIMRAHLTGRFDGPANKPQHISIRDQKRILDAKEGKRK